LDDKERAKTLFQVGTLMEKDGAYADAIEYYYRSEATAKLGELESEINAHVKNCFERLGKFSALRYEMMDRTSIKGEGDTGGKVVAEIGSEKITEADLDAIIESAVDNQLSSMSAYLTSEQLNAQKKKMLEQYKGTEAKENFLQGWVAQEILYRQALEEGLSEKPEVKKVLDEVTRGVLSQRLMDEQLASKINLTETDVQTYYEANKKNYVEPEKAKISHILVGDEEETKKVLERAKGGEDFGALAKEVSIDEKTKEAGGKIDGDVIKGGSIPGIGTSEELNAKIFAAKAGEVIAEPVKTEKGWEVVKVESLEPARQKSFDEVRQQVQMELLNKKRQEVQAEYIQQMMDKHNVIIHTSAFSGEGDKAS
jgi:peptidyl-prolyl cis-trans isomerase C